MTETARYTRGFIRRLRSGGAAAALALALCALLGSMEPARAQNLIADPDFTNGVPPDGSTDSAGNSYSDAGASAATMDGMTGAVLTAGNGYFQISQIAGFNPNGVNYMFSFLAATVDVSTPTSLNASFAPAIVPSCSECSNATISETLTSTGLTEYSFSATSSPSTDLGTSSNYLYIQNSGAGDLFVTGLDFEEQGAPAPVPGGGILSVCAAIAALTLHRMRRRRAA